MVLLEWLASKTITSLYSSILYKITELLFMLSLVNSCV